MKRRIAVTVILAVLGVVWVPEGHAQATWRPRLELDNDVYNYWIRHTQRPDEEYTNGVHASLEGLTAPWWGRRFAPQLADCAITTGSTPCRSTQVTLGQDLYTPHLDRTPHRVPDWELERPFFAWLFLRGSARVSSERSVSTTSLSLGVTGPPAGGKLAQTVAHRIGFNEQADGWETQIGFEPGAVLEYRRSVMAMRNAGEGMGFDMAPELGLSLGNIRTHVDAGAKIRVGRGLSHPWHPALWRDRSPVEWWLSAGGRVEYVARDMSLDGTLRQPSRQVERTPGVQQYEFGAGVRWQGVLLEYRAITRSREYRTGPSHHAYSTMSVALVPW